LSIFCLILDPPGREVGADELSPLLAPVSYLGSRGRSVWVSGNLAIGWLHHHGPVQSEHAAFAQQAMAGPLILAADVRLDSRAELLRQLGGTREVEGPVSDEWLVLAAYRRWKRDCARHLLGDFAFVVFDRETQALYGCTDAMGTRRLFCGELASGRLIIASEEACLLSVPELTERWSETGLACWMSASPHRELSLFERIRVIACGRQLDRTPAGSRTSRWWPPQDLPEVRYRRRDDYVACYRELLTRAVADRMPAGGAPVLCHLSGGMDSSTITAAAVATGGTERVATVSYHYRGFANCDETAFVAQTRRLLGIRESIEVDGAAVTLADASNPALIRRESPLAGEFQGLRQELREASRLGCEVILIGNGGDELTAGSPNAATLERLRRADLSVLGELYRSARTRGLSLPRHLLNRIGRPALRLALPLTLRQWLLERRAVSRQLPPWLRHRRELVKSVAERLQPYGEYAGLTDYQLTLLRMLRRSGSWVTLDCCRLNSGAAGLDVRAPFLDLRLLEFALGTPPDLWCRQNYNKYLPRLAFSASLPHDVCWTRGKIVLDEFVASTWDRQRALIRSVIGQAKSRLDPASAAFRMMPAAHELDAAPNHRAKFTYTAYLAAWINQRHPPI